MDLSKDLIHLIRFINCQTWLLIQCEQICSMAFAGAISKGKYNYNSVNGTTYSWELHKGSLAIHYFQ